MEFKQIIKYDIKNKISKLFVLNFYNKYKSHSFLLIIFNFLSLSLCII